MESKKYQVFISSTYIDLIEERRKVMDALLMADCIPAGMEAFVATDDEQFNVIKKVIDLCDYYILVIGRRYGSINPSTNQSYTEMEYEYAKSKGIPVLVFAIDTTITLPSNKIETDTNRIEKLTQFREKALNNRLASIWIDSGDLAGKVAIAIMQAKREIKRPGWQRAVDYDEASLRKQIMELTEKNQELENSLNAAEEKILELTSYNDLAFEDCNYTIGYTYYIRIGTSLSGVPRHGKKSSNKTLALTKIFEKIATEMMGVSTTEDRITTIICHLIDSTQRIYLDDEQIPKKILNQLKELHLVKSTWSDERKALYWGLTTKGQKVRNEMILIKSK